MRYTLVFTAYPLPVGSNFVLGELISQGRLLGIYIPLKLQIIASLQYFFWGGGLKTPDPRLLRPCYQRQTILLVSASKRIIIIIIIIIIFIFIFIIIIISQDARLDVHARGFWERQRSAFFDVRVCHPNAESYKELTPKQIYRIDENEKKRMYNQRVTDIEQGTFTPLIFTTTGGMGEECKKYHSRLAELIAIKKGEKYSKTMAWIRAKISFSIIRSALLCLQGSRITRKKQRDVKDTDIDIETEIARIY